MQGDPTGMLYGLVGAGRDAAAVIRDHVPPGRVRFHAVGRLSEGRELDLPRDAAAIAALPEGMARLPAGSRSSPRARR